MKKITISKKLLALLSTTVFIVGLSAASPVNAKDPDIEYTFEKKDSNSLLITLGFKGEKSGNTLLQLPNEWAGQQLLYQAVSNLDAISTETSIGPTGKQDQYSINYNPGTRVILSYVLRKDWKGPLVYPQYFRPVIEDSFFYFEGYSGLVYPVLNDSARITTRITYKGWQGQFTGNSFFSYEKTKTFTTTLADILNSIFCAGNFRSKQAEIGNTKIIVALRGNFTFTDEEAFSPITQIIQQERAFWADNRQPYFFVLLLPMQDRGNSGGTAHYNSFSLFQSDNLKPKEALLTLISHEYFHNWLGQGLKMPQPEEVYKWFSEGFTDYYSYKLLYGMNVLSKNDFINTINKLIREYYLSTYFSTGNEQLIGNYWTNPELKLLSYRRGLLIAFVLESNIAREKKGSLDDLVKNLYTQSKPRLIFSNELFDKLCTDYAGPAVLDAIKKANNGENEQLTRQLIDHSLYKIRLLTINKQFDLGFNIEESKKIKKIVGLKDGSNAAKADLAEGMEITNEFSIWNNNTEKPAKVRVVRNGNKEWVEYIPSRVVNIQIPQIVLEE